MPVLEVVALESSTSDGRCVFLSRMYMFRPPLRQKTHRYPHKKSLKKKTYTLPHEKPLKLKTHLYPHKKPHKLKTHMCREDSHKLNIPTRWIASTT